MILKKTDQIYILSKTDKQFSKFIKFIKNVGYKLCLEKIGEEFIKYSLETTTHIVVVGTQVNRELRSAKKSIDFTKVRGFALLKNKSNHLYLDLICGSGTGKVIFKHIANVAQKLGKSVIKLSAVPSAMFQYYKPEYGFVFGNTCKMNQDIRNKANLVFKQKLLLMSQQKEFYKQLEKASNSNKKEIKKKITQIQRKLTSQQKGIETMLGKKNLGAKKNCFKSKSCNVNGYKMTKCI